MNIITEQGMEINVYKMLRSSTVLYVSGLDVLGQSPRHNICAFIELPCYLNCFIKIAYIMLNKYSWNWKIYYKSTKYI